jgi:hypothetical protein
MGTAGRYMSTDSKESTASTNSEKTAYYEYIYGSD